MCALLCAFCTAGDSPALRCVQHLRAIPVFPFGKTSLNIYYQKRAENASGFYAAMRRRAAVCRAFLFFARLTFPIRALHFRYSRLFCTGRRAPRRRAAAPFFRTRWFNFLHRSGCPPRAKPLAAPPKMRQMCNFYTKIRKKKMIFCTEMTVKLFTSS